MLASDVLIFWQITTALRPEVCLERRQPAADSRLVDAKCVGSCVITVTPNDRFVLRCSADYGVRWMDSDRKVLQQSWNADQSTSELHFDVNSTKAGQYICVISPTVNGGRSDTDLITVVDIKESTIKSALPVVAWQSIDSSIAEFGSHPELCVGWAAENQSIYTIDWILPSAINRLPTDERSVSWRTFAPVVDSLSSSSQYFTSCLLIFGAVADHQGLYQWRLTRDQGDMKEIVLSTSFSVRIASDDLRTMVSSNRTDYVRLVANTFYTIGCWIRARGGDGDSLSTSSAIRTTFKILQEQQNSSCIMEPTESYGLPILATNHRQVRRRSQHVDVGHVVLVKTGNESTSTRFVCSIETADSESEIERTLNYTIFDDERFLHRQSNMLIDAKLNDIPMDISIGKVIVPTEQPFTLRCMIVRCIYDSIQWTFSNETVSFVELSTVNSSASKITNALGYTSRFYSQSSLIDVLELRLNSTKVEHTDVYRCIANTGTVTEEASITVISLRANAGVPRKGRTHILKIPHLIDRQTVQISSKYAPISCTEAMQPTMIGVVAAAIFGLLLVGIGTMVICDRLSRANLLKRSSRFGQSVRTQSIRIRLISNHGQSLEEASI